MAIPQPLSLSLSLSALLNPGLGAKGSRDNSLKALSTRYNAGGRHPAKSQTLREYAEEIMEQKVAPSAIQRLMVCDSVILALFCFELFQKAILSLF